MEFLVEEVCMESTSIYWMPVWRVLENYVSLKLGNPYFIKQLPGKKSDVKGAECVRKLDKLDAALQRCNIRISNYVSTTDGKSYKEVVRLISEWIRVPAELAKVIHGRIVWGNCILLGFWKSGRNPRDSFGKVEICL